MGVCRKTDLRGSQYKRNIKIHSRVCVFDFRAICAGIGLWVEAVAKQFATALGRGECLHRKAQTHCFQDG